VAVPWEASNLKITTPQDLVVAEVLLSSGLTRSAAAEAGS
jgi:2-C-methyl-D-erythritol 4-phosphate cytidylyltransferase